MIHAFNFTCLRDLDLSILMMETFKKHCPSGSISTTNTDTTPAYKEYGNGAGWPASIMKLKALSDIIKTKKVEDTDFILSVDSDVVFCSAEVFKYVNPEYGIIGIKHRPEFHTHFGSWSHMSGCLIFIRGDVARKMTALSTGELNDIRYQHFKAYSLTENEDVVLSYLARYVGAKYFDLGEVSGLSSGDFEGDIKQYSFMQVIDLKSFYHLNYCPKFFLGEPVDGKWNIPKVLESKGIKL